jgi:hypothetical protein
MYNCYTSVGKQLKPNSPVLSHADQQENDFNVSHRHNPACFEAVPYSPTKQQILV